MKFLITTWQGEIVHYEHETGKLKALPEIVKCDEVSPLLMDRNGLIENSNSKNIRLNIDINGDYLKILDLDSGLYFSARQSGVVRPFSKKWEKWEQFFYKEYIDNKEIINTKIKNLNIEKFEIKNNKDRNSTKIPKIIWMFWDGTSMPDIVDACINNIKYLNKNYDVRICNFENLKKYIDISFNDDVEIPLAVKADWVRLNLLYKYGGVWIDASTIFSTSLDDMFSSIDDLDKQDLISFHTDKFNDSGFPVMEVWFLAAPPNNKFMEKWIEAFFPLISLGAKKYLEQLSKRNDYYDLIKGISDPEYLALYVAARIVLTENKDSLNVFFWNAFYSAFSMQYHFNWDQDYIMSFLCKGNEKFLNLPKTPLLKLTKGSRKSLDKICEDDKLRMNSFMYRFLRDNKS